ncbi:MAG: hypothetical protein JST24_05995 [Acidobacteria bacterium]|nr:hypothetical protein [Acidobacteriota bacterium]
MLERLRLALRLRGAWEAVDSGYALLRAHGRLVYALWLAAFAPAAAALYWTFWNRAWIALLLLWWLLPIFGRFALHALAKATFGEQPTVRSTLKDAKGIYRHGTVAGLLWRRIGLNRAFTLPIWQLEGQGGSGYRRRAPVLLRRTHGPSALFTVFSFLLLIVFSMAIWIGILYLAPEGLLDQAKNLVATGGGPGPLFYLLPAVAMAVLEPFYLAGGFGLYLNRRIQLEAWDLDLAFRRLAQRLRAGLGRTVAVLLIFAGLVMGSRLWARTPEVPNSPKAELKEVLKAPEFQTWSQERTWHWKDWKEAEPRSKSQIPEWVFKLLGQILKGLIIIAVLSGVAWFLWRFLLSRSGGWVKDEEASYQPDDLFGLDIRPGSLPKDIPGTALALWREGERRAALSLLYRGALARLVHERGLEVSPGATEGDCLRAASPVLDTEGVGYFRGLTFAWQALAYAHADSADGEALCEGWRRHFGGGRG